jgi:hypothetical protein
VCPPDHPLLPSLQVPDTHSVIVVEFLSRYSIENPQQSPVTLYDYYDPGEYI